MDVWRAERADDGDCLLRIFDLSLRRMRWGIIDRKDGDHEKGSLAFE